MTARTTLPDELHFMPLGDRMLKGIGSEPVAEVAWIREIARISDALDQITLILTEKGTIVVELAKDAKQEIRDALEQLRRARPEEDGLISAFLQRSMAGLTKRLIGVPYAGLRIAREQDIGLLKFSLKGNTLGIRSSDGGFSLKGVDPLVAQGFLHHVDELSVARQQATTSQLASGS
jgi:hypothetical protein